MRKQEMQNEMVEILDEIVAYTACTSCGAEAAVHPCADGTYTYRCRNCGESELITPPKGWTR